MPYLTSARAEGPTLNPYGTPCPHVLSLTVARRHEVDVLPQWLDALPNAHKLCAAICLKGLGCDDPQTSAVLDKLRTRVHSCVEEPGGDANGHEGVCAFRFLVDNYDRPWRNVFFLHGDLAPVAQGTVRKHAGQFHSFKEFLERDEWPAWPSSTMEKMTGRICGCGAFGDMHNPFGPVDFWYKTITWWLGNFIALRDPHAEATAHEWMAAADCDARHGECARSGAGAYLLHNGTLKSPIGYMFNLDRKSALQRSREWLRAQYRMNLVGVRAMPPGWSDAHRAAWLPSPGFDYAPLVWGHVNERLPFFQFGHEFVERPVPPCVWAGDHATMNCSQSHPPIRATARLPTVSQQGLQHGAQHSAQHGTTHGGHHDQRQRLMMNPEAKAARPSGCNAFDNSCGSRG